MRYKLETELRSKVLTHFTRFDKIRNNLSDLNDAIESLRKNIDFFSNNHQDAIRISDEFLELNEKVQIELKNLEEERERSNRTLAELEDKYGKGKIDITNPEYYETYI